jgi:putative acetyltransferase
MDDVEQTTPCRIRLIEPRDDAAIAAVIRAVMPEFGAGGAGFAIHDREVDAMHDAYAVPGARYFVLERGGELLGGAGVAALAGGDGAICELRKMYVVPAARGRGAGRALLRCCLQAAGELGYRRCYIETLTGMDRAQALYLAAGFEPIPERLGATGHFGCDLFYLYTLDTP